MKHPKMRDKRRRGSRFHLPRRDAAISDVLSSLLMVGVTVALVASTAVGFGNARVEEKADVVHTITMTAMASANSTKVTLYHMGGEVISGGDARAIILVNGVKWKEQALPGVRWDVGDSVTIPLGQPIPLGAKVTVDVVRKITHSPYASVSFDAVAGPTLSAVTNATSLNFTLNVTLGSGAASLILEPPAELLIQAKVAHPAGRKFVRSVSANLSAIAGAGWVELKDDGTNGDLRPGDGTFSALVLVPVNATMGVKTLAISATDLNGITASKNATIDILRRADSAEESLNPNGAALPAKNNPRCLNSKADITSVLYTVNGVRTFRDMTGRLSPNDTLRVNITVGPGCATAPVALIAYRATAPQFTWSNATLAVVDSLDIRTLSEGNHTLSITVPSCYFQVSLAYGAPILVQGPTTSDNYYSRQGRLIDSDSGGTRSC